MGSTALISGNETYKFYAHRANLNCDGTLADTMPLHWRAWQIVA
jgi:hypothetical protein